MAERPTAPVRRRTRICLWSALALLGALACLGVGCSPLGDGADAAPAARANAAEFNGARAMALLRAQVRVGPRPAGSGNLRRLALWLRPLLPDGRFEPVPGRPGGLRNIVGRLPGRAPALLVGAHYDTKALPGFVGANDGAAGTAAVLELARVLARDQRACSREIRFVLFDGEESFDDRRPFYTTGLRGSRAYAARHARALGSAVIVDFVAGHGVRLPREVGSDPRLWHRLRVAAGQVGVGAIFPAEVRGEVLDDHTPFARAGVPAIDVIDFSYPHWHRPSDNLAAVSQRSLASVGAALAHFLRGEADRGCVG